MKIKNSRLVDNSGKMVPFESTPHGGASFSGGRPKFLVIHYTAGSSGATAVDWFQNPNAQASAHLVVDHDGSITQMAKFDETTWHAGESRWKEFTRLNQHSIGIEIANWGKLERDGGGGWMSWTGTQVPASRVVMAEHKNHPGATFGWEVFDKLQWQATVDAAKAIVEEFGLEPWDVIGHDDISPIRKVDPGPAFDMNRFRAFVFGRKEDSWNDEVYVVQSPSGLNLRKTSDLSEKPIKNLPNGTQVHVIERVSKWWLVAEIVNGDDDVTGFVHSSWLRPA